MDQNKLTAIARFTAKPGQEARLKQELRKLQSASRPEDGCICFDLYQSADNVTDFFFFEVWSGRAALDKHLATPHVKDFASQADALLAKPIDATFWTQVD